MESNIKGLVSAGHEMASELKAECGAVDMRSVAKLISDLATQLEVQLVRANALAAENAALKESEREFDKMCAEEFGPDWVSEFTETPATDAFLAEVRAQGVDAAIEHLINKFQSTGHIGVPVMALEHFADQLRKGGDQ